MKTSFVKTILASLCLSAFVTGQAQNQVHAAGSNYSEVEAYVRAQMAAWHIPGAAVVIVQDGQVAYLQTFGRAGTDRPVTAQTPFEIGSCSKSFTALAIMQLVESGTMNLDAPVQQYLPWFRVADEAASSLITVRHLLNHTSGLPSQTNGLTMVNPNGKTLEGQVRSMSRLSLTAAPGTVYQYSNYNYMTLAQIIETVTGQAYGDYLNENIFSPLDMQNSYTDVALARERGYSGGYTWWFGLPFRSLEKPRPDMLGAGYIMLSPQDMGHYLIAQLNNGVYENGRVLSAVGIASMHAPAQLSSGGSSYGMGWVKFEENGAPIINHNGQSASFTCSMILLPNRGTGIAVMANVSSLLGPHAAASLAFRIKDMIVTGQAAQVDPSYRKFYIPWNIGFFIATFVLFLSFFSLMRGNMTLAFAVDGLFMLAAFLCLPFALGWAKWLGMFVWQPDAAYWCLAAGCLLLAKISLRAAILIRHGRQLHP